MATVKKEALIPNAAHASPVFPVRMAYEERLACEEAMSLLPGSWRSLGAFMRAGALQLAQQIKERHAADAAKATKATKAKPKKGVK